MNNDKIMLDAYKSVIEDGAIFSCIQCGEKMGKFDAVRVIKTKVGEKTCATIGHVQCAIRGQKQR